MAPRTLFLDEHPGMSQTRFMQWGEVWVRLSLTPGATAQDDLVAMVRPDRMIVLPVALEGIPTQDPQETGSALLSLAEQGGRVAAKKTGLVARCRRAGRRTWRIMVLETSAWIPPVFPQTSSNAAARSG